VKAQLEWAALPILGNWSPRVGCISLRLRLFYFQDLAAMKLCAAWRGPSEFRKQQHEHHPTAGDHARHRIVPATVKHWARPRDRNTS